MENPAPVKRGRGRPRKPVGDLDGVREKLVRSGVVFLTEKGFNATGLDEILGAVGVPKGSFYHYFGSKEAFGMELINRYAAYFAKRLAGFYSQPDQTPFERFVSFMSAVEVSMARYHFQRGCLVGNLGQEMAVLPQSYQVRLIEIFEEWQRLTADCLRDAVEAGEVHADLDCAATAKAFWIGWEGAVLRAKLERDAEPLRAYGSFFADAIKKR